MMDNVSPTLLKGRITELKCELWFLERGFIVSVPEIPCQYDMVIDVDNKLYKIQIKTCHLSNEGDYLEFNTSSITHNKNGYTQRIYNSNSVDYFMTTYKDEYYLVPFEECGTSAKRLRLIPTKSGQVKNISFAKDFLAEKILNLEEVVK